MAKSDGNFRILSLDGGGSKGLYTLGILNEIEARLKRPLCEEFDLIYGTSTGAIISSLVALGWPIDEVRKKYIEIVPDVMNQCGKKAKSRTLKEHAEKLFGNAGFDQFKTDVGIVAMNYERSKPMIFKSSVQQSFSMEATFQPGFGCSIADALRASSAAFPFFEKVKLTTANQGDVLLIDGGFIANNPTLLAIADAVHAYKIEKHKIKVLSLGTGIFKEPKLPLHQRIVLLSSYAQLALKILEANSVTIEQLRQLLFKDIPTVRINDTAMQNELEANLLTSDVAKLMKLYVFGRESYSNCEADLIAKFNW